MNMVILHFNILTYWVRVLEGGVFPNIKKEEGKE
jgi:hypothetical protein